MIKKPTVGESEIHRKCQNGYALRTNEKGIGVAIKCHISQSYADGY